jgi:hypothetical protein
VKERHTDGYIVGTWSSELDSLDRIGSVDSKFNFSSGVGNGCSELDLRVEKLNCITVGASV